MANLGIWWRLLRALDYTLSVNLATASLSRSMSAQGRYRPLKLAWIWRPQRQFTEAMAGIVNEMCGSFQTTDAVQAEPKTFEPRVQPNTGKMAP
jgi:hypothetical protein